jgi:RNase adaptor protein for sRNA GlmZ degradation
MQEMCVSHHSYLLESRSSRQVLICDSEQAVLQITTHLNAGNDVANVQVTCHAGTHRSVAAAEMITGILRVRGVGDVRVRHAHRRKRPGDLV